MDTPPTTLANRAALLCATCLCGWLVAARASANPEPTAYDTRSVGLGLSGVSYLERPAAIAMNPANLEGVDTFSFSVLTNPFFVTQTAPVQGPGSRVDADMGVGPLGSLFLAGRIAPKAVLGVGVYLETAYGSSFSGVTELDGVLSNGDPEDLKLNFLVGEVALGSSISLSDKVSIGIALRVPFARQDATQFRNISPIVEGLGQGFSGTKALYSRADSTLKGVGYPSARIGITYKPIPLLTLGAGYRPYAKIPLKGEVETPLFPTAQASSEWTLPHALQFGAAFHFLDDRLLLAIEERMQFHGAPRTGNDYQTVTAVVDLGSTTSTTEVFVPLDWRNLYSTKVGLEFQASQRVAVRVGSSLGTSATTQRFAQYFTPPPGFAWLASAGVGFEWKHFSLDLATAVTGAGGTIAADVADSGPVTFAGRTFNLCSEDQVTRTGCAGEYRVTTYWTSITFTYRR